MKLTIRLGVERLDFFTEFEFGKLVVFLKLVGHLSGEVSFSRPLVNNRDD